MIVTEKENIEIIGENLICYYLHEGRIVVFEPTGVVRATVDAWHDGTLAVANAWEEGKPYHELHDMRKSSITPYARQKALELVAALGDRDGRSAIVISETYTGQLIGFFVNNVFNRFNKHRKRLVFTDFNAALRWLEEAL